MNLRSLAAAMLLLLTLPVAAQDAHVRAANALRAALAGAPVPSRRS